jgi:transcriptional regulator with XRE-family HTH domain
LTHPFGELSALRQQLGAALRRLRTDARLSGEQIAAQAGISQSRVSRIELGQQSAPVTVVQRWAQAAGASETETAELTELAEAAATQATTWRKAMARGLVRLQEDSRNFESTAATILNFQSMRIPGLLQVPEYARRVFAADHPPGHPDIAAAVAARMNRQAILYDESKHLEFLIAEVALRWPIGPPGLMRAQLDRLIMAGDLGNVVIGIIPLDAEISVWHDHGFNIIDDTDGDAVVHVETLTTGLTITDPADVALYREVFGQLRRNALVGPAAKQLLERVTAGYHSRDPET